MQKEDEVWQNPKFKLEFNYFIKIVKELDKTPLDRNEIFNKKGGLELGNLIKESTPSKDGVLWNLLFRNQEGEYKDNGIDTLWTASKYLERVYFGHENKNNQCKDNEEFQTPVKNLQNVNEESILQNTELKVKHDRTFATSSSTFERLTNLDVFVDKSLFIRNIIDDSSEAILITRPRRWGKTLNMDMLKTFLEIEVDRKGVKLTEDYDLANPKLFKNLSIIKGEYINTVKISNLLLESQTQKSVKLNNRKTIDELIEKLEDTFYDEWLQIRDEVLKLKNERSSYRKYIT